MTGSFYVQFSYQKVTYGEVYNYGFDVVMLYRHLPICIFSQELVLLNIFVKLFAVDITSEYGTN